MLAAMKRKVTPKEVARLESLQRERKKQNEQNEIDRLAARDEHPSSQN